jgi:hypothetical protein
MSQQTPVLEPKELVPPEERFWQRYSPHHEFPLSSAGSVVLHVLSIGALVVLGYVLSRAGGDQPTAPPLIGVIASPNLPRGGGGQDADRDDAPPLGKADVAKDATTPQPGSKVPEAVKLKDVVLPKLQIKSSETGKRLIVGTDQAVFSDLDALIERARSELNKPKAPAGRPNAGPGPGGRGGAPPGQLLTPQQKRRARWKMFFPTVGGEDYLKQLHGLGAILAIPRLKGNRQLEYLVIRDIRKVAEARPEDVAKLNLMFWFDHDQRSVRLVAQALGLRNPPPFFVAFFPEKLEDRLRALEQQAYSGDEDRIVETRFRVVRDGESYRVVLDGENAVVLKRN